MPGWRVDILCEDHRTERFLLRLCQRFGVGVLHVYIAPDGKGSASNWVMKQYPLQTRRRRSKNYQKFFGLLVAVDGDEIGFHKRKEQLAKLAPREGSEPIALFVPTWAIETWLAFLCDAESVTEDQKLKKLEPYARLWKDGETEAATILQASQRWPGTAPLSSLADSVVEGRRIGLG